MGRELHANIFSRRSLARVILILEHTPPDAWQQHLFAAWKVLKRLNALDHVARAVIIESVKAAQAYIAAETRCVHLIEQMGRFAEIKSACSQICNCTKRAPAKLRRRLDQVIPPILRESLIDWEVIESIFSAADDVFAEFIEYEVSGTARHALSELRVSQLSSLNSILRLEIQGKLASLMEGSGEPSAQAVFAAIVDALGPSTKVDKSKRAKPLIVNYVVDVATIWRRAGLKPGRAVNPGYQGKFHQFADYVLTAMVEPGSRRHDRDLNERREKIAPHHADLPEEDRKLVSADPSRMDEQPLVAEDHVRCALARLKT